MTDWSTMGAVPGDDGRARCGWCLGSPDYVAYHDDEWGRPVVDDVRLFEKVCLEGFDPERVARFDDADVARLLADAGIVRHRGKIEAAVANARATLDVQADLGSLATLIWSYEPDRARPAPETMGDIASVTPESTALAKELKRRGFRFVGPTTAYAAMQSLGVVDDHLAGCHSRVACEADRRSTAVPA